MDLLFLQALLLALIAKSENSQLTPFLVLQPNLAYEHVQWAHKKLNKLSTFKNQEIIFKILPEKNVSILTKLRVSSQLHKECLCMPSYLTWSLHLSFWSPSNLFQTLMLSTC